jgi:hypothetical protein
MASSPRPWTVLPHRPIEPLEDNLWCVEADLPKGPLNRRMTVFRLGDGRLVFHNGVPLDDASMAVLEAWGAPAFLVVPVPGHRLDVHAFAARYPGLKVLCPREIAHSVGQAVRVDGGLELLPKDPLLEVVPLEGTKTGEAVFVSRSPDGARQSLVFGDAVMNVPHLPGALGLVLRLVGSSGGVKVTGLARLMLVKDKRALAEHLRRLAAVPGVTRLIPSHGENAVAAAAAKLRVCADALG